MHREQPPDDRDRHPLGSVGAEVQTDRGEETKAGPTLSRVRGSVKPRAVEDRDLDQSVIVSVLLAVSTVAPPELRSVIVSVAEPALSARICQVTDELPPAGTVGSDWLVLRGFSARIELEGLKPTSTVYPLAEPPLVLATEPVALKNCPRAMLEGTPLSVRSNVGAAGVGVLVGVGGGG